jgi:FtsP/CotA-like multicopper oxidase with cupredoxin domain
MNKRWPIAAAAVFVAAGSIAFYAYRGDAAQVRTYYIAADTITWDYAPSGANRISGEAFTPVENLLMAPGPNLIGRRLHKAIYREYTDSTFTTLKPREPQWEHLGILGPMVRAVVGDTIRVIFRNHTALSLSVHPHGVFYNKDSEGAIYADGTSAGDKADDGVPPGGSHTYVWPVPERAGPTEHEGSTAFWMYHSHVNEIRDVNTGLIGAMIVTRRGMARADGSPKDVDREVVASLLEFDENHSWYIDRNIRANATRPADLFTDIGVFGGMAVISRATPAPVFGYYFRETINGLSYGHAEGLTMNVGQKVRWYVMANTNFEIHAPHWHGNVVTINSMRTDVAALLPMGMLVADMVPDNPGQWLFHCHVADHLRMGMSSTYQVAPRQVASR